MSTSRSGLATVLLVALVAGCAVNEPARATPTPTATPVGAPSAENGSSGPTTAPPSSTTSPVSPRPSPVALGGFTTPVPPDARTAWTGIAWRKLAPDDPLAQVRSVVRWRGGFVALGARIATGETSRTPVWSSTDGRTWRPLDIEVFGPDTVLLGVGETADGLAAVTLHGGLDGTSAAPLESWTSPDGATWTAHPGPPGFAAPSVGCDGCGVRVPIFGSGTPGLLLVNDSGTEAGAGSPASFSDDGVTWQDLAAATFPAGIGFHDVAGFRSGFIATGEQGVTVKGEETIRAIALSSADGRTWVERDLPAAPGLDPQNGSSAGGLVVGPEGVIATGGTADMSGVDIWWSSVTGRTWSLIAGYPPLGVDPNAEAGSRINGTLFGDGERMLAYRGGDKPAGWTSTDGRSWHAIAIHDGVAIGADAVTPIGLLGTGADGSIWFGAPLS